MQSALLQDWITINGMESVSSFIQSAHRYVDIGQHEDLVFYLDVRSTDSAATLVYETAPTQQSSLFLPMLAPVPMNVGLRVDRAMFATAAVPPAKYVRWRIARSAANPWTVTFRVWLAAYAYASKRPRVA